MRETREITMNKYYMIAELTMDDGTVEISDRIDNIKDANDNIIREQIFNMTYEEWYQDFKCPYGNYIAYAFEIKDFVKDYFKEKLNLGTTMKSFKFYFVENETNKISHYLEMNPIIKYIDYDIVLKKFESETKKGKKITMNSKKEKKKLYVVRSLRMTNWLCQRKFELLKVEDAIDDPHFKVFLFADTPELRTSINQFYKEIKEV